MARFRLRFLLHEFDLPSDEVYIGRGAVCGLTIDDPLVSREHARLFIKEGEAWVEDLGSRNGVRVDGRVITSPTVLYDGAQLRIGTQEMNLRRLEEEPLRAGKKVATGFLVHCETCGRPYGTQETSCPHCGEIVTEIEQVDQPKNSVVSAWSMELLVETMSRASSLGRTADTERLLTQAREVLETITAPVERRRLDQFAQAAIAVALKSDSPDWAIWALKLFTDRGLMPRPEVGQQLSELPPSSRESISPQVDELLKVAQLSAHADTHEVEAIQALESFTALAVSTAPDTYDEGDRQKNSASDSGEVHS